MQKKELTYEQALERLEQLAMQMEQAEVPIDEMADRLREAQQLLRYCRMRLTSADDAVKKILAKDGEEG
ncbi:MAG: exodeoxyribonuclease VII small subunit [Bacteroidaceae bacterium]|nr:exodeoxyribonuclease VII small subunit [Bacteroidaceae bacterium]